MYKTPMEILSGGYKENLEVMESDELLSELLDLADQMGIDVRHAAMDADGGGLCRLRGTWVLFVDKNASSVEQAACVAESLGGRSDLEEYYIKPQVREVIEAMRGDDP